MRPLTLAALALLLVAPLATATEDVAWALEPRSVDLQASSGGFTFTSDRDSAIATDTISGAFDGGSATLTAALRAQRPEAVDERIDVTWRALVEYRDVDGDGRYGLADPAVQSIAIASLPHDAALAPTIGGARSVTTTYQFPDNDSSPGPVPVGGGLPSPPGALELTFTLLPAPATVGSTALRPTDIATSVRVRDFPWKAGDTRLALLVDASSPSGVDPGADKLTASSGTYSWEARWSPQAVRDGTTVPSAWSAVAQPDRATAILDLGRAGTAQQDGSLAAHHVTTESVVALPHLAPGSPLAYGAGALIAFAALGVPSWRRLRGA